MCTERWNKTTAPQKKRKEESPGKGKTTGDISTVLWKNETREKRADVRPWNLDKSWRPESDVRTSLGQWKKRHPNHEEAVQVISTANQVPCKVKSSFSMRPVAKKCRNGRTDTFIGWAQCVKGSNREIQTLSSPASWAFIRLRSNPMISAKKKVKKKWTFGQEVALKTHSHGLDGLPSLSINPPRKKLHQSLAPN